MAEPVTVERHGDIALVRIVHPPVNALSAEVRAGLRAALAGLAAASGVAALVLAGDGRAFCAGADLGELGSGHRDRGPPLPEVIAALEEAPWPVIAAIHGAALGGGCELALGCHYRMIAADARIGLPEVGLGLIPGAGGTQRLPRLIGLGPALELILSGEPVTAGRALELGLADRLAGDDLIAEALEWAAELAAEGAVPPRTRERPIPDAGEAQAILDAARERLARRPGPAAPGHALEALAGALELDFEAALARERELFLACRDSEESAALRHLFRAERAARKVAGLGPETPVAEVASAGVVGFGTMGVGIAMSLAGAGLPVRVVEPDEAAWERGRERAAALYRSAIAKGRLSPGEAEARLARIERVGDAGGLAGADLVIEAVIEERALKEQVFRDLEAACRPDAILATNTSTLDVDALAAVTTRPERVVGTHFFSPAHVMRLVEVVRGQATSAPTLATVLALARRLGKVAVVVGVCDGFVGNRMYHRYTRQAYLMLEEGALPETIDAALEAFGFAMGPLRVADLAGLDVSYRIRRRQAASRPAEERYCPIPDRLCELGRYGQKSGAGFYRYQGRRALPDPEVERLIVEHSRAAGIERRAIAAEEIRERCLYALVNEGARLLEEGIAARAGDIDVVWRYGYGFPAWRGGPMWHAERVGLARVRDALARHAERTADARLVPAPLLERLAAAGASFYPR